MMLKANLHIFRLFGLVLLALSLGASTTEGKNKHCTPSSCGNIRNISYPFRLKGHPPNCGRPSLDFELTCENNRTTLFLQSVKFYVQSIFYDNDSIRLVDASLDRNTCSIPQTIPISVSSFYSYDPSYNASLLFLNCKVPMNSSSYVDFSACVRNSSYPHRYFYALHDPSVPELPDNQLCIIKAVVKTALMSSLDIHQELLQGFVLNWQDLPQDLFDDKMSWKERFINSIVAILYFLQIFLTGQVDVFNIFIVGFISGRALLGILFLIAILIYKFRHRHLSMDDTIEEFLQSHNNLMPIRYSYSHIKSITKGFEDKLGQGGFGSVFKGKLRSGHLAAIKMLRESGANGQDFMNEVSTIGRIHHVNVVKLIGFCVEGSKRALVYEFMPNGSLDKFIFANRDNSTFLSWDRMYEIALGVARGIEYLHQGCAMQILHFDIKPHNILLDENFIPKLSDFGLAKLYPVDDSIVSLTAARGTLGYIAPELFYKNIGGISYKADVYSFGMLLMEMVGRRKNLNPFVEQLSQIYFPSWIYDKLVQEENLELGNASEGEKETARKMIIVAFWCIQMKPINRPSMSKVLEMLEGQVELLQMPPKPFFGPEEMVIEDNASNISAETPTISATSTITLDVLYVMNRTSY